MLAVNQYLKQNLPTKVDVLSFWHAYWYDVMTCILIFHNGIHALKAFVYPLVVRNKLQNKTEYWDPFLNTWWSLVLWLLLSNSTPHPTLIITTNPFSQFWMPPKKYVTLPHFLYYSKYESVDILLCLLISYFSMIVKAELCQKRRCSNHLWSFNAFSSFIWLPKLVALQLSANLSVCVMTIYSQVILKHTRYRKEKIV